MGTAEKLNDITPAENRKYDIIADPPSVSNDQIVDKRSRGTRKRKSISYDDSFFTTIEKLDDIKPDANTSNLIEDNETAVSSSISNGQIEVDKPSQRRGIRNRKGIPYNYDSVENVDTEKGS